MSVDRASLRKRLEGLNRFLETVYTDKIFISDILKINQFSEWEINSLKKDDNVVDKILDEVLFGIYCFIQGAAHDSRAAKIVSMYYGFDRPAVSLQEIVDSFQISKECIRKIHKNIMSYLQSSKGIRRLEDIILKAVEKVTRNKEPYETSAGA